MFSNINKSTISFLVVTILVALTVVLLTAFSARKNLKMEILFTAPHTIQTIRFVPNRNSSRTVETIHLKELYVDKILDKIKARGYKVYYNTFDTIDPNYEADSVFRQKAYQKQNYNIDVHGMDDKHEADVSIGTAGVKYNTQRISQYLASLGLSLEINGLFKANERSLTKYLNQNHSVKSIQIELTLETRQRPDIDIILIKLAEIFAQDN